jgi:hypothetical protein
MLLDLPPQIEIAKPSIIRLGETWEAIVTRDLARKGFPLSVRQDVIRALRKVVGQKQAIIRAQESDLNDYLKRRSLDGLALGLGGSFAAHLGSGSAAAVGTIVEVAGRGDASNLTDYTFSSIDLSGYPNHIFAAIVYGGTTNTTRTFASFGVGAQGFTEVANTFVRVGGGGGNILAIFMTTTPVTYSGGVPSMSFSGGMANAACIVFALQHVNPTRHDYSTVAGSTSDGTRAMELDIPANGVLLAAFMSTNSSHGVAAGVSASSAVNPEGSVHVRGFYGDSDFSSAFESAQPGFDLENTIAYFGTSASFEPA